MARNPGLRSKDLLRRAQVAGVAGSILFGGALVGVAVRHHWLVFWTFIAFLGLGSILRASMLGIAAHRALRAEREKHEE
ncbi:MAG: hypothetical protein ACREF0_03245 [Acetobacteraceae bacterium]